VTLFKFSGARAVTPKAYLCNIGRPEPFEPALQFVGVLFCFPKHDAAFH
jgi:hypothetical protein